MSASINWLWKSLTPEEKRKIQDRLGVDPDSCRTSAQRAGLLAQYHEQTGHNPLPLFDTRPYHSPELVESGSRSHLRLVASEPPLEDVVSEERDPVILPRRESPSQRTLALSRGRYYHSPLTFYYPATNSVSQFLRKAVGSAAMVVFTLAGAYGGFSMARHTDLADELRKMERNPLVKTYQLTHGLESFQELREWDFLSPNREGIAKDRQYIDTAKSVAAGATGWAKWAVGNIPLVGGWIDGKIEQQQGLVNDYVQKRREYSSKMAWYTLAGTGLGLSFGVFLSFQLGKRRRP